MKYNRDFTIDIIEHLIPFHEFANVKVKDVSLGYAKLHFPIKKEFIGDFSNQSWHSGMIAAMLEITGTAAAISLMASLKERVAPVEMNVSYLDPTENEDIIVEANVIKKRRPIIYTEMNAYHQNYYSKLATGRVDFIIREQ